MRTVLLPRGLAGALWLAAFAAAPSVAAGQTPPIPVLTVSEPQAVSADTFRIVFGVQELRGGGILVNDARARRLVTLDRDLRLATIVLDSVSGAVNSYGTRSVQLIPFTADSSLFVDFATQSLLVIDPTGNVARVMAAPKPSDLTYLASGSARTDSRGRLIYRSFAFPQPTLAELNAPTRVMVAPDSMPLVRADFDTRAVDTVARVKAGGGTTSTSTRSTAPGSPPTMTSTIDPLPTYDDWTIHADGSIAIVRGFDYHIDWISPDGTMTSSPKMPYAWRRLTTEDKEQLIDSMRKAMDESMRRVDSMRAAAAAASGGRAINIIRPTYEYFPPDKILDYYPPIRPGAVSADRDGNIWILPYTSAQGPEKGIVYDVVNRKGELYMRVRLPEGRSIAGFGADGVLYLMNGSLDAGWRIERVRVLRD